MSENQKLVTTLVTSTSRKNSARIDKELEEAKKPLSEADKAELKRLEGIIERNMKNYFEIGNALIHINSKNLYRADYSTFEDYCLAKWGFGRAYGYRHINGAVVHNTLKGLLTIGDKPLPQSEAQARHLVKFKDEPQKMVKAWNAALKKADGGQVTEALVSEVVAKMTGHAKGKKGATKTVTDDTPKGDSKSAAPVDTTDTKPEAEVAGEPKPSPAFNVIAILELLDDLRACEAEGDSDGVFKCADDIERLINGKPDTKPAEPKDQPDKASAAQQEEKNEQAEHDEEEHGDDRTDDECEQEADGDHGDDQEGKFEGEPGEIVMNRR